MAKYYNSFLIRYWRSDSDEARIVIEHIQSDDAARVMSLRAAVAWLEEQSGGMGDPFPVHAEPRPARTRS